MKKVIIAAVISVFALGSNATFASGQLAPISAEDMMNHLTCKDKKPTDVVKSRTQVKDGKIVKVKCGDVEAIIAKARKDSGDAWQGGY